MHAPSDTIVAISTAPGVGGISVVRVSGPDSLALADRAFRGRGRPPSARESHTVHHGHLVADHGDLLDEVLLLIMRAPRSFTGEDVVEFHCHGGHVPASRAVRRLVECGGRPAEPGEFTRRAFLHGKIDLTQAEGVLDLIHANSERAATAALRQLQGLLGRSIEEIRTSALDVASTLESSLDFPEEDLLPPSLSDLAQSLRQGARRCRTLASSCHEGRLLRDGIRIVIAGRPNAGKSSLFNLLLGTPRAIVSPRPGTTRDTIEAWLSLDGYGVNLVDTAGICVSPCEIEQEGIRRSLSELSSSDIVLFVVDATVRAETVDIKSIADIDPGAVLIAFNKMDLLGRPFPTTCASGFETLSISCTDVSYRQIIIDKLLAMIRCRFKEHEVIGPAVSERHRVLLDSAANAFTTAADILSSGESEGIAPACSLLRTGIDALGAITGRHFDDDLLDGIFSKFCIGK